MEFTTSATLAVQGAVQTIVYGGAGAGKTMLAATAPAPILISLEEGLLSMTPANVAKVFGSQPHTPDIPVIVVRSVQEFVSTLQWLETAPDARQFQTVCVDSLSALGELILAQTKEAAKASSSRADTWKAYGDLVDISLGLISRLKRLPFHLYLSAKVERMKDEETGRMLFGPSMPGNKLGQQIPYLFDEVLCLRTLAGEGGAVNRWLQTQPDPSYDAKDRSGALDPYEIPHLGHLISKIQHGVQVT